MKCSFCDQHAVYKFRNLYYCKEHFIKYFEAKVFATIRRFNLIAEGDKVGVAVSGGKDSLSLFYFLDKYKKELGIKKLVGIHIDEGIKNYRDILTDYLIKISKKFGWEIKIYRFKDIFGFELDEAVKIEDKLKPCTICGTWRRWIINHFAKELGLDKIATAHNLNDEAQTIFMNILDGNIKDYVKGGPWVGVKEFEGFVPRIKPFYFVSEKETMIYSILNGINPPWTECPYIRGQIRDEVRKRLYRLEDLHPGLHFNLVLNYVNSLDKLKEKYSYSFKLRRCKICGEPTTHEICRACEIKIILGKKAGKEFS